jgi:hypothetical protein
MDNEAWLYDNLRTEIKRYKGEIPSASVGADSDEFDSTTLNVAWTAIGAIASGTVSELETGAIDKYDLATFPGWIAFQSNNDGPSVTLQDFAIRKAFTPGTGPWSVVARVGVWNGSRDLTKDQMIGIIVGDDTTPTNYTALCFGQAGGGATTLVFRNQAGAIDTIGLDADEIWCAYIALVRESAGGNTTAWVSYDGLGWHYLNVTAGAPAINYLWVGVRQDVPTIRPIYLCDFVRTFATATLVCGRAGNS